MKIKITSGIFIGQQYEVKPKQLDANDGLTIIDNGVYLYFSDDEYEFIDTEDKE